MTACIVGWAHSQFGKLPEETVESLIIKVAGDALAHAGIGPEDVDEIVLGHFNAGFSAQDFTASLVLQADDRLRFKPATRVENACATGSAAVRQGIRAIDANAAKVVLVVGVEQMTTTKGPDVGRNLLKASYLPEEGDTPAGFAGVFGGIAQSYFQRLDRLHRRARKDRPRDVADRQHLAAVAIEHRQRAAMAAFDHISAGDFDQNRIRHYLPSRPTARHIPICLPERKRTAS